MRELILSDKNALIYRIIFAGLSWFTLIASAIYYSISYGVFLPWFNQYKSFTMQTNLMITIWLTLAIIWHKKPETLNKITGPLKGALTLYITITFLFFAVFLSFLYTPTGFAAYTNLIFHYILPIAFIIDWVLTENKIKYRWNYLLYWIIYPIGYVVFVFIHGAFTGDYLYYFLDISALGILAFAVIPFLILLGLIIGFVYIFINRKRT
ncbi:MAG: Pr6Pr family membrane protein [Candidatus Thorarchaeota archaeon]